MLPGGATLPRELSGGSFDTSFVDTELRISRGDRGELRVFVKDGGGAGAYSDD